MELIVGARNKKEVAKIDELVAIFSAIPLTAEVSTASHELLRKYSKSHGLRVFDSLIAATAMVGDFILVTKNKKHFQMIDGLKFRFPNY